MVPNKLFEMASAIIQLPQCLFRKLFSELQHLSLLFGFRYRTWHIGFLIKVKEDLRTALFLPGMISRRELVFRTSFAVNRRSAEPFPEYADKQIAVSDLQYRIDQPLRPDGMKTRMCIGFPSQ